MKVPVPLRFAIIAILVGIVTNTYQIAMFGTGLMLGMLSRMLEDDGL